MLEELNNIENFYRNLVEELFKNSYFRNLLEYPCEGSADEFIYINEESYPEIQFEHGCSKFVLYSINEKYVLKFPLRDETDGEDLCKTEVDLYKKVVGTSIEKMFAPCYFLGEIHDTPFYIMERAYEFNLHENSIHYDLIGYLKFDGWEAEEAAEHVLNLDGEDVVHELFSMQYDMDKVEQLQDFCEMNGVNDLHCGNVGYIGDNLVLIDYSGYHYGDEEEESEWSLTL